MTFCGFTGRMLTSIQEFQGELERAVRGESVGRIKARIAEEMQDMHAFISEAHRLPQSTRRDQLLGLWQFGYTFYAAVEERVATGATYNGAFNSERRRTIEILENIDLHYYTDLKGKVAEPIPALVAFVNRVYLQPETVR